MSGRVFMVAVAALVGCGGADDGGGGRADARTGGTVDAAPDDGFAPAECRKQCATVADCAWDLADIYSEDNWRCESGECRHLGCLSDDECGPTTACRSFNDLGPLCHSRCQTRDDCDFGPGIGSPDNYECIDGACRYLGCNDTADCVETYTAEWVCKKFSFDAVRGCVEVCDTVSDCTYPEASVCFEGACIFACSNDAWCNDTQARGPGDYVCR